MFGREPYMGGFDNPLETMYSVNSGLSLPEKVAPPSPEEFSSNNLPKLAKIPSTVHNHARIIRSTYWPLNNLKVLNNDLFYYANIFIAGGVLIRKWFSLVKLILTCSCPRLILSWIIQCLFFSPTMLDENEARTCFKKL